MIRGAHRALPPGVAAVSRHDEGHIVVLSCHPGIHLLENAWADHVDRTFVEPSDRFSEPSFSEHLASGVAGLGDTVRVEDQQVPWPETEAPPERARGEVRGAGCGVLSSCSCRVAGPRRTRRAR
jgi:hypothetical protein